MRLSPRHHRASRRELPRIKKYNLIAIYESAVPPVARRPPKVTAPARALVLLYANRKKKKKKSLTRARVTQLYFGGYNFFIFLIIFFFFFFVYTTALHIRRAATATRRFAKSAPRRPGDYAHRVFFTTTIIIELDCFRNRLGLDDRYCSAS